MILNQFGFM